MTNGILATMKLIPLMTSCNVHKKIYRVRSQHKGQNRWYQSNDANAKEVPYDELMSLADYLIIFSGLRLDVHR